MPNCPICNRRLFFQERENEKLSFSVDKIFIPCLFYCPECKLHFKYEMKYELYEMESMEEELE